MVYLCLNNGMSFLYKVARSVLFKADPEKAHDATLHAMKAGIFPRNASVIDDALVQEVL